MEFSLCLKSFEMSAVSFCLYCRIFVTLMMLNVLDLKTKRGERLTSIMGKTE